jgi:uncharacterized protein YciI
MNKPLLLSFSFILLSVVGAAAQGSTTALKNPDYDEALAKKLGGNDNGMKTYVLAILKTGPNDASVKGDERKKAFEGHMANIGRLADEGKLAVAGPFGKNDKTFRGLFIFNVATIEDAQKLAETDPAIKAGIFVVDYIPWFGSASLMATSDIHKKISKSKE